MTNPPPVGVRKPPPPLGPPSVRVAVGRVSRSGLSKERVEWHLWNWEQWMHRASQAGHLPATASGWDCRTYDNDSERAYEFACILAAEAVQAILSGLVPRLRLAVYIKHGISRVYRVRDQDEAYSEACEIIGVQLAARALC